MARPWLRYTRLAPRPTHPALKEAYPHWQRTANSAQRRRPATRSNASNRRAAVTEARQPIARAPAPAKTRLGRQGERGSFFTTRATEFSGALV